ncbi:MAG TPA: LuxR C-terminal-related transcriptional regulator [Actinomycetota bacterium]|nr:LuxR C-terminal-related transcriptional regulator [Actinomycetota bacterium]
MTEVLEQGRKAFANQEWADARLHLSAAAEDSPLEIDDLERQATAAYLAGRADESVELWATAHQDCAHRADAARAARCASWLAFILLNRGELARGGGWVDRGQRLLDAGEVDCVEHGYLRYCTALRQVFEGDVVAAQAGFGEAVEIADRFHDPQLATLARIGEGRCLIYLGEIAKGVALLDEGMVAVGAKEISPIAEGDAYCTVIDGCHELFDVRRMHEWTTALSRWCEAQPQLVMYRGLCFVHRAEIMQLRGEWSDAMNELEGALGRLAEPVGSPELGAAFYLRGEIHRLRGRFEEAADSYRQANELGREPQPGLALLRLAQGRVEAAMAAIRRVLEEAGDPISRSRLLAPYVEVALAAGDVQAGKAAATELSAIAAELASPLLQALAEYATGIALLAENEPQQALVLLRHSWMGWRALEASYEAARARVAIASACRAIGDDEGAEMELDAARSVFEGLAAAPDIARVAELSRMAPPGASDGLTAREVEVLSLIATGMTNRAIATELVISEKTVASHVSHIFTKLDLTSRSAATAYAYEHDLVRGRRDS